MLKPRLKARLSASLGNVANWKNLPRQHISHYNTHKLAGIFFLLHRDPFQANRFSNIYTVFSIGKQAGFFIYLKNNNSIAVLIGNQ
jgi:hypothetical protein